MILQFAVEKQTIRRADSDRPATDSREYLKAQFGFSADWDGMTRRAAILAAADGTVYTVELHDNACVIPETLTTRDAGGALIVSAVGWDAQGEKRITTDMCVVSIATSGYTTAGAPGEMPKDIVTTMRNAVEAMSAKMAEIEKTLREGAGLGDMVKMVYDTDGDGRVNAADTAKDADALQGHTAQDFAAAAHRHAWADITDAPEPGSGQAGEDGGYYTPEVDDTGVLSWTASRDGMPTIASANIRGPAGPQGETGQRGPEGPQGERGADGPQGPAYTLTETDKNDIANTVIESIGDIGTGGGGSGENGGYYTPTVDSSTGILSWTASKAGMPAVTAQNIRGPEGPQGAEGPRGQQGATGNDGPQGPRGNDGAPGAAGENGGYYTPTVDSSTGMLSWTASKAGMPAVTAQNIRGPEGPQGATGNDGPQGPEYTLTDSDTNTIRDAVVAAISGTLDGKADASHTQAASTITAGTLAGRVQANAGAQETLGDAQVRDIVIAQDAPDSAGNGVIWLQYS